MLSSMAPIGSGTCVPYDYSGELYPDSVAIFEDVIYVLFPKSEMVEKFDFDGNRISSWGGYGSNEGQFIDPSAIAVNNQGAVFILDKGNHRIQEFDPQGNFVSKWGTEGMKGGEFYYPQGMYIDDQNCIYVADTKKHHIQKYCPKSQ